MKINIKECGTIVEKLFDLAKEAREQAYAPYSKYKVGAAVLGDNGKISSGCNIENAAYLVTHAEEMALGNMRRNEGKRVKIVVCVTRDAGACCGNCRQKIWEFCGNNKALEIYCFDLEGNGLFFTIGELLPYAFDLGFVEEM